MSNSFPALEKVKTAAVSAVFMLQSPHHLPPVWLVTPFLLFLFMVIDAVAGKGVIKER